jgi:hypothetical protein
MRLSSTRFAEGFFAKSKAITVAVRARAAEAIGRAALTLARDFPTRARGRFAHRIRFADTQKRRAPHEHKLSTHTQEEFTLTFKSKRRSRGRL